MTLVTPTKFCMSSNELAGGWIGSLPGRTGGTGIAIEAEFDGKSRQGVQAVIPSLGGILFLDMMATTELAKALTNDILRLVKLGYTSFKSGA